MRYEQKSLLTVAVLVIGTAAACTVIESRAPEVEPLAARPEPARPDAAQPAIATLPAHEVAAAPEPTAPEAPRIDFTTEIQPLLEGCRPCHFEGGKMYAQMPFDDPATIRHEGEALFTRITDEDAQALIRAFLAEGKE